MPVQLHRRGALSPRLLPESRHRDQVRQLEPSFDYALDEQCFEYNECSKLRPFVQAHKAVFEVEYNLATSRFCAQARAEGFMSMRKRLNLGASRQPCW